MWAQNGESCQPLHASAIYPDAGHERGARDSALRGFRRGTWFDPHHLLSLSPECSLLLLPMSKFPFGILVLAQVLGQLSSPV